MKIIWRFFIMKIILLTSSIGQPIYEPQPRQLSDVKEIEVMPIISSPCARYNGRCWGWLSIPETENYRLQDDLDIPKFQRSINGEQDLPQWKRKSLAFEDEAIEMRSTSPVIRQISSKPMKKDVFMPRSWGAGGMPFSVLYMNPHGTRMSHPPTTDTPKTSRESPKKSTDVSSTPSKQPNNRAGAKNGTSQPRRQYSIIPQLFISYGWGPFAK